LYFDRAPTNLHPHPHPTDFDL